MRTRLAGLLLFVFIGGCDSATPPTAARCGEARPGFDNVVAGMDNNFFTAMSRQAVQIKTGVDVKVVSDETGKPVELTMARDNAEVGVICSCPAGCSTPGPVGCIIQYEPGGADASCSGDCVSENTCCSGCGWITASP